MKKIIFIFLLTFTSQLYAYQFTDGSASVFAELLIWKLREGSADNWAQNISPSGLYQTVKLFEVPFNWKPGVRIGLDYNCNDVWDSVLYYTRYETNAVNHATGIIYSAFLGNFYINNTNGGDFGPHYRAGGVQWKFLFNTVDLELGHTFKIDQILKLRPFLGLKTAFINQDIHTNWQDPINAAGFTSAIENLKNDFWGIGPAIGLNTTWSIYKDPRYSFNLLGNFSGALLWGHWRFNQYYENNTPATVTVYNNNITGAATMARGILGIEWVGCLSKTDIAVRLGYEAQIWFNQLQYYSYNMGKLNNLMSLQGGVLNFAINL